MEKSKMVKILIGGALVVAVLAPLVYNAWTARQTGQPTFPGPADSPIVTPATQQATLSVPSVSPLPHFSVTGGGGDRGFGGDD